MFGAESQPSMAVANNKRLMEWLVNLHSTLNKDKIDLREIDSLVKILEHYNEDAKDNYINALIYPETAIQAKLPTLFPIPSTAFQMHLTYMQSTFSSGNPGNFAWTWNPFFLQDNGVGAWTSFYFNNNAGLNGTSTSAFFLPVDLQYNQIPTGVYGSYRVVSASVVLSYVGKMDSVSGVLGIGIGLNNQGVATPSLVSGATADTASSFFGQFNQIDNLYFHERTQAANGLRAIYFPVDDKYTYFLPLLTNAGPGSTTTSTYNTGFYFAGYGQGLPASSGGVRFDFYINYECLVQPQFNNFIPSSPSNSSSVDVLKTAGDLIANTPELVIKPGSEIPGKKSLDVGTGGYLSKIIGNGEPVLDMNVKDMYRLVNKWY